MLGAGPNPPRYIPTLTEVVDALPPGEPVVFAAPPDALFAPVNAPVEADVEQMLLRITDQLACQLEQQLQAWCQQHARVWADQCVRAVEPMLREAWIQSRGARETPGCGPVEGGRSVTE